MHVRTTMHKDNEQSSLSLRRNVQINALRGAFSFVLAHCSIAEAKAQAIKPLKTH
jgi:hypothetical protein